MAQGDHELLHMKVISENLNNKRERKQTFYYNERTNKPFNKDKLESVFICISVSTNHQVIDIFAFLNNSKFQTTYLS